ncbi:MAG: metallophosphoesterase [Bacteroidales bacterium]|nr:metallophosphoesterase [Bacteroidales bacterium]MCF6341824.1 metallophosphoesterase [Bacteroidales bacterium]
MEVKNSLLAILVIIFSSVCVLQGQDTVSYIFLGHLKQSSPPGDKVDYRVEQMDFSVYNGVWLGGDVCGEAMLNYSTVQYIDSIFDLGNPETHWALGNHDARNGNWEWYRKFSGRNTYYAFSSHGITRIVMNTNILPVDCEMLDNQNTIIENVCDTVQQSDYLILIMHHGLWKNVPGLPYPGAYAHSDLEFWNSNCYDVNSTFLNHVYPLLIKVKNKGIKVICILGDMGAGAKTFEMFSDDGILFLGCGLYHNEPDDMVLILNKIGDTLKYGFHNLDSLLLAQ